MVRVVTISYERHLRPGLVFSALLSTFINTFINTFTITSPIYHGSLSHWDKRR